jgi:uncharacterized protein (TIGR00255 family)
MTASMTAFARLQSEHAFGTLVWEIRAVNHRYLEPVFRLPEHLRHLEMPLRDALRQGVQRGKVEAQLRHSSGKVADTRVALDDGVVQQLAASLDAVQSRFGRLADINPIDLLRWPGLLQETEVDQRQVEEAATALFSATLDQFQQQRLREGKELQRLIEERLAQVSAIVAAIREDLPKILAKQADRLKTQFADLQLQVDSTRLEQEIVLAAQRADIHEELDRLDTHVKEVQHTLRQKGQVGRRLDFLMQEFNREANTLCSKAVVTSTTFSAVELKVLIEQMREQIQNIE